MKRRSLSRQQKSVLDFVIKYLQEYGYGPSYREIGSALGLKSPASVWAHIHNLINLGYLKKRSFSRGLQPTRKAWQTKGVLKLPLLGDIRAGQPITVYPDPQTFVLPASLGLQDDRDYFVLRVRGDSMKEEGIFDGDYVICEKTEYAQDGQVVVALVGGEQVTLKKIYQEENYIRLQPANSSMDPIFVRRVDIQGVVRAVIRRY